MARAIGPDPADRLAYTLRVDDALGMGSGLPAVYYAAATGSTLADVLNVDGSPLPGATLPCTAYSQLPQVQYPDNVNTIYVSVDGGPRSPVRASIAGGTGTVTGPGSSVDGQVPVFNGTTGVALRASAVAVDANGDMTGLRRLVRALSVDPATPGITRTDITYTVSTSSSDIEQLRINNTTVSWRNESGFWRGTPNTHYKDDAVVRAVQRSDLSTETGSAFELQNSARTQILYGRRWRDGKLMRGDGTAAASAMADVFVTTVGATLPAGLPAGTVIVRI